MSSEIDGIDKERFGGNMELMNKTTTNRVYLNLREDDLLIIDELHKELEQETGVKITNAHLFRLSLRALAREKGIL